MTLDAGCNFSDLASLEVLVKPPIPGIYPGPASHRPKDDRGT
jgi:hypothetical protein